MLRMPKEKAPTSREVGASASVVRLRACGLRAQGDGEALPPARRLLPTLRAGILTCGSSACGAFPVFVRALAARCVRCGCVMAACVWRSGANCAFLHHKADQWHNAAASPLTVAWPWGTFTLSSLRTRALDSDAYVNVRRRLVGRVALRPSNAAGVRVALGGMGCQWSFCRGVFLPCGAIGLKPSKKPCISGYFAGYTLDCAQH